MHPILFEIPGVGPVYSYGVMLGTSLLAAWFLIMWLGETKEGLDTDTMAGTFITTAIVAIVMSRVLYILTNPEDFGDPADWFNFSAGGLVAYGGFLGGLLGSWLYLRRKPGASLLGWADVVAPTLGIGLGATRIGCYLYGCDFGAPLSADAPSWLRDWGTFPRHADGTGSPAWSHHVAEYDLSPLSDYSLPVHPTQLYESLFGLALAGLALWLWRRRAFKGQIILTITALYAVWRFFIEYVRDDPERGFYLGFSTSQLISLALLPMVGFLYQQLAKQAKQAPVPAEEPPAEKPRKKKAKKKKRA